MVVGGGGRGEGGNPQATSLSLLTDLVVGGTDMRGESAEFSGQLAVSRACWYYVSFIVFFLFFFVRGRLRNPESE